jgi:hypothetical protein
MGAPGERMVRRRHVFYVPGYDPLSPRRYRELYRTEAARQAAISGYSIAVRGLTGLPNYAWEARAGIEGGATVATIEFLAWHDIVKGTLDRPVAAIYLLMLRTLWCFLASGALVAMLRLRPGPMIAGLAPVGFMLLYLVAAGLAGWAVAAAADAAGAPPWLGLVLAATAFAGVMAATRALEPRLYTYYLVCDYGYVAKANGAWPPELSARLSGFADRIGTVLAQGEADEVLIVGHSSGAQMAVAIVADLLRRGLPPGAPAVALLTLGQAIPMTSFLPEARQLRADLAALAAADGIAWIDVSAMGDGASFALCDPVAVTGVAPAGKRWPLVLSAAFSRTLSPERQRHLRWRFFLRHVQYLCAFDRPGDYDYFRITAGPQTLAARFAGRRPSPSREERVFSPHRSLA